MTNATLLQSLSEAGEGSRELDALIAVEVGGFYVCEPRYDGAPVAYGYVDAKGHRTEPGQGGLMLVPKYTTSLDAALALAERVTGGAYKLVNDYGGYNRAEINLPGRETHTAVAETMPLALCIAILKALPPQSTEEARS